MEAYYEHAIACAKRGDVDFFKTVAPEILLNASGGFGTVLTEAAVEGHLDCCEVIVERCPQLLYHQHNRDKSSVLHDVIAFSRDKNVENIMRFLLFTADSKPDLELGGGPKIPNYRLLTMHDMFDRTALHWAVFKGNHGATKLLLEADRDFRLRRMVDDDGKTCLHLAVDSGDQDTVKLICEADLDKQLLSMPDEDNNTPLHLAVRDCEVEIVKLLIERDIVTVYCAVNNDNQTPLSMAMDKAAKYGPGSDAEVTCKVLLENDWTKVVDFHGQNVVHVAAYHGHLSVVQHFLESKDTDVVALFNSQDEDGNTPLHLAVSNGNVEVVRLLVEAHPMSEHKGTNISTKTPYMMDKNEECSKSDLELGGGARLANKRLIDYCAVNKSNKTPLLVAMDKVAARDGSGSVSDVICKLLLEKDPSQCTKQTGHKGWMPLHYAAFHGLNNIAEDIIRLCPDCIKAEDTDGRTPYMISTRRILPDEHRECSISDISLVRLLLEKDPQQCTKPKDKHEQPFIHAAVERGLTVVVKTILESKEIDATILNMKDENGNTPLHIAALGPNEEMTLCLLYDARVSKRIRNNKLEYAIDLINFTYDEAKAMVYSLGHQSDLRDQSSFDLLVAVLIATVSFTAGITVPGGYISDGANKGSAILLKATAFKVFVVSNNFALLFSLFSVFLKFSSRRLLKEDNIYYDPEMGTFRTRLLLKKKDMINQLNAATLCTLAAVYAMVVAFITGSYAVLAKSDGLAITVCVSSCFFLILVSRAMWTMAKQYLHSSKKFE